MKVKPGCVITDVARPLDLPPSEVAKRPDVMVIESGEIQLPGDVQMKNIGLIIISRGIKCSWIIRIVLYMCRIQSWNAI
jgi:predicted amino acid dehydrogenase